MGSFFFSKLSISFPPRGIWQTAQTTCQSLEIAFHWTAFEIPQFDWSTNFWQLEGARENCFHVSPVHKGFRFLNLFSLYLCGKCGLLFNKYIIIVYLIISQRSKIVPRKNYINKRKLPKLSSLYECSQHAHWHVAANIFLK